MMQTIDGIPVFGDPVDEGALRQIRKAKENAAYAALMADHHLGYGVPIGGVVAYRDAISPTGVGYDIACFSGDTRVFSMDGTYPTLRELEGKRVWVLSSTEDGEPVPSEALCLKTKKSAPLVEVHLDNGEIITCTPDHKFMLRNGDYLEASCLEIGQSLMPFYSTKDKDGYVLVRNNRTKNLFRLHYQVFRSGLIESVDLPKDERLVIHHKNFIRHDNRPENLQAMSKSAHDKYHANLRSKAHFNTPEFTKKRLDGIRRFWDKARTDKNFMNKRAATASANLERGKAEKQHKFESNSKLAGQRGRKGLIAWNKSDKAKKLATRRKELGRQCDICGERVGSTNSLFWHTHKRHPEKMNNHKVVLVKPIDRREDVFCLVVPGYNNFALAAGVFVHNCGNKAVRLDLKVDNIRVPETMDMIVREIAFGVGRKNNERVDHSIFDDDAWSIPAVAPLKEMARQQLGTVGSGNHYVDVFAGDDGYVWIGVHFGSRGLGHKIATYFLKAGGAQDSIDAEPLVLKVGTPLADDYLACMGLAGKYAYAGRDWVCGKVAAVIDAQIVEEVHNHHNFAWQEEHFGEKLWVVRKGATPAFPGQLSFVGGSMGDSSYILRGKDSELSKAAMYSTVHGAGRVMSRTAARGKFNRKTGERKTEGAISRESMQDWLREKGVVLRGADVDEAPQAYKRIDEVLAHHADTVEIVHKLTPLGVAMAGSEIVDPYKD